MSAKEMPCCASVMAKIWPVSSVGRKPFGMIIEERERHEKKDNGDHQRDKAVFEHPREAPLITVPQVIEEPLQDHVKPAMLLFAGRLQEPAAEHGGQRKGHNAGDEDGHGDHDREFMQQASEDAAHEEHGDEHRDE